MSDENNTAEVVRDLAQKLALSAAGVTDQGKGSEPFMLVPEGFHYKSMEEFLAAPLRIEQAPSFQRVADFIEYVKKFGTADTQVFFGRNGCFTAVIDYHEKAKPSWCTHRPSFGPQHTRNWQTWLGMSGKYQTQEQFAEFLEENAIDVQKPSGADIMEIVQSLQAAKSVEFKQSIRLENGNVGFKFIETTQATAGRTGEMEIPAEITLGLSVFEGETPVAVRAAFRYRLADARVTFSYKILNADRYIEAAVGAFEKRIADGLGGLASARPLMGNP